MQKDIKLLSSDFFFHAAMCFQANKFNNDVQEHTVNRIIKQIKFFFQPS